MNTTLCTLLLERARTGDDAAQGELLEEFRPYVRAVARGLGGERLRGHVDEADLVQDFRLVRVPR